MSTQLPMYKLRYPLVITIFSTLFLFSFLSTVFAKEKDISSIEDWNSGTFTNSKLTETGVGIELEAEGSWNALMWRTPDKSISAGAAFTSDGTHVYVIRGLGDNVFWKYTPSTDTWANLKSLPFGVYLGSDLQYLNGYVYAIFGGYQKKFARYSVENNSWEILGDYPGSQKRFSSNYCTE